MTNRLLILWAAVLALLIASIPLISAGQSEKRSWNFDMDRTDGIARGFTSEVGDWKIVADGSAPTKPNVSMKAPLSHPSDGSASAASCARDAMPSTRRRCAGWTFRRRMD